MGWESRLIKFCALCALLWACSERHAGGNSAETGNPSIAGRLFSRDGLPAARIQISCVPPDYHPLRDSLSERWVTQTDSVGSFVLQAPSRHCVLEAMDHRGDRLYLPLRSDSSAQIVISATLIPVVRLRLGVPGIPEGSGYLVVPGSTIVRRAQVAFGSIFADSLPAGILDSILFVPDNGVAVVVGRNLSLTGELAVIDAPPIRYQRKISLNTASGESRIIQEIRGFPLLLRLNGEQVNFAALDSATPMRVRIRESLLPYRILRWDRQRQYAEIWVRLDTLRSLDSAQHLILEWDETASSPKIGTRLFAKMDGYVAAWHFDDRPDRFLDDGEWAYDGVPVAVRSVEGVVGRAFYFNGKDSYVHIPGSERGPLDISASDTLSISLWVRPERLNTSRFVFGKGGSQFFLKYQYPVGWWYEVRTRESLTARFYATIDWDSLAVGDWVHLAVVQKDSSVMIYKNGILVADSSVSSNSSAVKNTNLPFEIGRWLMDENGTYGQVFQGEIDEMFISRAERTAEWVRLEYLNQKLFDYWPR